MSILTVADTRRRSSNISPQVKEKLRTGNHFDWKTFCFFCGTILKKQKELKTKLRSVVTLQLKQNMLKRAVARQDSWGTEVASRLQNCADLVAEEAVYHSDCISKFMGQSAPKYPNVGRPVDTDKTEAFNKICNWLERDSDCELHTIKELMEKMEQLCNENDDTYTEKSLCAKLKEKYKEHIYFTDLPGRQSVVCFRDMVSYILLEKKKKAEELKDSIIIAAAKIIKAELRDIDKDNKVYPTTEEIRSTQSQKEWVPESLQLLLSYLIPSKLKQLDIGQCITQCSRPRSIVCPGVFELGVQLEKSFGSKWLVNHLYRLGYSISYDEVVRYKQSAINCTPSTPEIENGSFCQWVADNVDHNLVTLTGKGIFHGMGVIAVNSSALTNGVAITRIKEKLRLR